VKHLVKKDIKFRKKQKSFELKKLCIKFFVIYVLNFKQKNINKYYFFKFILLLKLNMYSKLKYSKSLLVRRCILTGRSRSSTRSVGNISRNSLKDLFSMGLIPGYKKAVW